MKEKISELMPRFSRPMILSELLTTYCRQDEVGTVQLLPTAKARRRGGDLQKLFLEEPRPQHILT